MKKLILILLPATFLSARAAQPASQPPIDIDSLERALSLNEIVVTGTRTPKLLKDTPVQTRLITAADIRTSDASTILDLLQSELPGVEFSYAMNQQVNMNVSGFSGQSVLVLVDGERLAGETMDNVDFSRLNMEQVARIEVIKGASSALYGSSAAGGVINIITKKADRPWALDLNVRGADHHEWRYGGTLSLSHRRVDNILSVSHQRISTYSVCLDPSDQCDFRTVHGNRTWNVSDKFSWRPLDGLTLSARAGYFFKERYYNVDTPDRYRDFSGGLRGEWQISPADKLELSYTFDQYDKSDFIVATGKDIRDYRNLQHSVRTLYNRTLRQSDILTVGGDFMRDYLDTYQFHSAAKTQVSADIFAQYDWNISKAWEMVGALRYDYFSDDDISRVTGKLSARYRHNHLTLRAGYAGGFRAPTLKEKYMDFDMAGIFDIHGNPDLKSETSHNFNLSAEYTWRNYNFTLGGGYNFVDDKISTSGILYGETGPFINYINVKNLKVATAEAAIQARYDCGISARLSYAYTREETEGASVTQYCPARPHSLNVRLGWAHDWADNYSTDIVLSGRVYSSVSYQSMYMYEPFEPRCITNPAYTLWKIQLTQNIYRGIHLNIAVDNIFNYAPKVYSYNAPVTLGANLMVGLNLSLHELVK